MVRSHHGDAAANGWLLLQIVVFGFDDEGVEEKKGVPFMHELGEHHPPPTLPSRQTLRPTFLARTALRGRQALPPSKSISGALCAKWTRYLASEAPR